MAWWNKALLYSGASGAGASIFFRRLDRAAGEGDNRFDEPPVQEGQVVRHVLLGALLLWPALASAADLSKLDRTIKKEPAYQGKPKYCLLAFGPEAKAKAWLVLCPTRRPVPAPPRPACSTFSAR